MDYEEVLFAVQPAEDFVCDVLSAELGEIGFESFVATGNGVQAFCPADLFSEEKLQALLAEFPLEAKISYTITPVKAQNWNEEWEKHYFEPIVIGEDCVIRSSFHKQVPAARYDILIDPRMSFGTGHHETTSLMLAAMLKLDLRGKSLLDMGCGTAVLAILAAMKGAAPVTGIDIDEWAYNNALDNIRLNNCEEIEILQGGAELLAGRQFDVIFANINRNILVADMEAYAACLQSGGELYMSGFYKDDIPVIEARANELGLQLVDFSEKNNWVAVRTIKN
ncbi:MAG: 50S ribosomal protein L11 methyltransferase [Prevotellaceae bacterium]|jgi:ribosomal protein L11 methyltransferase|nr:50S ribosomal protein L11 methyltransferase [Prevotellaceae bacterium]